MLVERARAEVITLGQAMAYVLSGMYGPVKATPHLPFPARQLVKRAPTQRLKDLGAGNAILIILQLFCAGVIAPRPVWENRGPRPEEYIGFCLTAQVLILDELLQKGYGLGSGRLGYRLSSPLLFSCVQASPSLLRPTSEPCWQRFLSCVLSVLCNSIWPSCGLKSANMPELR